MTDERKFYELPKEHWYRCPVCNGKGSYYSGGDAHRSPGIIPCGCNGGMKTSQYMTEGEYRELTGGWLGESWKNQ